MLLTQLAELYPGIFDSGDLKPGLYWSGNTSVFLTLTPITENPYLNSSMERIVAYEDRENLLEMFGNKPNRPREINPPKVLFFAGWGNDDRFCQFTNNNPIFLSGEDLVEKMEELGWKKCQVEWYNARDERETEDGWISPEGVVINKNLTSIARKFYGEYGWK